MKSPAAANPDTRRVQRHAAKPIGIETWLDLREANVRDGTDAWTRSSLTPNATLTGDVAQAGFVDDLPGTSVSIAAQGHRAYIAGLFGFKFWAFEDQKRCQRWRWRRADAQVGRRPSLRPFTHAMRDARRSGALATRRQTEVLR
jgi:hypothetical protein